MLKKRWRYWYKCKAVKIMIINLNELFFDRDLAAATVLVGIILVFIVCHSFKFVVNIYEAYLAHIGELCEQHQLNFYIFETNFLAESTHFQNFLILSYQFLFQERTRKKIGLSGWMELSVFPTCFRPSTPPWIS